MKEKGKREEVTVWLFGWVNNWKEKYNNILIQKNLCPYKVVQNLSF